MPLHFAPPPERNRHFDITALPDRHFIGDLLDFSANLAKFDSSQKLG